MCSCHQLGNRARRGIRIQGKERYQDTGQGEVSGYRARRGIRIQGREVSGYRAGGSLIQGRG